MPEEPEHKRRVDDWDRQLADRLERLERQHDQIRATVVSLENTVNTVKLEQAHMREIVDARLRMIEEAGKLQLVKLDDLKALIGDQAADPRKSPAGREVMTRIDDIEKAFDERGVKVDSLVSWRARAEGAISLLNWVGAAGLVGFGLAMLRILKLIP